VGSDSGGGRARARILVADDEPSLREFLRIVLGEDYEVIEAANGLEALDLARELPPDLFVLDVMMPGRSGLEVLAEVRRDPSLAETPVIMITAWDDVQAHGLASGAELVLTKPFDPEDLRTAVERLLAAR
jgi:CheY-like chemotaxis protein